MGQTNSFLHVLFPVKLGILYFLVGQEVGGMSLFSEFSFVSLVSLYVRGNTGQGIYSFFGEKCLIAWTILFPPVSCVIYDVTAFSLPPDTPTLQPDFYFCLTMFSPHSLFIFLRVRSPVPVVLRFSPSLPPFFEFSTFDPKGVIDLLAHCSIL